MRLSAFTQEPRTQSACSNIAQEDPHPVPAVLTLQRLLVSLLHAACPWGRVSFYMHGDYMGPALPDYSSDGDTRLATGAAGPAWHALVQVLGLFGTGPQAQSPGR